MVSGQHGQRLDVDRGLMCECTCPMGCLVHFGWPPIREVHKLWMFRCACSFTRPHCSCSMATTVAGVRGSLDLHRGKLQRELQATSRARGRTDLRSGCANQPARRKGAAEVTASRGQGCWTSPTALSTGPALCLSARESRSSPCGCRLGK
jgi:hypothetical protein